MVKLPGSPVLAFAILLAPLAPAAAQTCPLALVLALDASSSVDAGEYRLQSQGLARALVDGQVRAAISNLGGVLMTAFEWSGRNQQVVIADWAFLDDDAAIVRFAGRLAGHPRTYVEFPTAIGYALGFAATRIARAPVNCARRVVDVSGDGVQNEGFSPALAYRAFDFARITVNGLVIKGADPDPEPYYREQVLHGPGAFLEIAAGYDDYARAIRRKLLRELGSPAVAELR